MFCDYYLHYYQQTPTLPVSPHIIIDFIACLDIRGYAGSTILTFISALGHYYKVQDLNPPLSNYNVNRVVSSLAKKSGPDARLPITLPILEDIITYLLSTHNRAYHLLLFKAVYLLAFFACLRISEFAECTGLNPHVLQHNAITLYPNYFTVSFTTYKHSCHPIVIVVKAIPNASLCPHQAISNYLKVRPAINGPLFIREGGTPLTRSYFNENLKQALQHIGIPHKNYTSHSFRIGGATNALLTGHTMEQIQLLGRWQSSAFRKYLRPFELLAN